MPKIVKIGLIREGKTPADSRVALTPHQCAFVQRNFPVHITVEPSPDRSFENAEYSEKNIFLHEDLSDCDLLLGIKEVPISKLIANKTYFFFSHTIKKQAYNRGLLQTVLQKNITLIDYEVLTSDDGARLIAFGKFAGMVGCHNGMIAYGKRSKAYDLPRMIDLHDYAHARQVYEKTPFPKSLKIVVTGTGRVAHGIIEVLQDMGFEEVKPQDFLVKAYPYSVFTVLTPAEYVMRKDGKEYDKKDFYQNPSQYISIFSPYTKVADVLMNGIYYDRRSPAFFTLKEMQAPDFSIRTIADVTCDMMPFSSVPATIKATTIAEPFYGFDALKNAECEPFTPTSVDMMTIDNLPNELPRDASEFFGDQFIAAILPEILLQNQYSRILERATIAKNGELMPRYAYLQDFVNEETATI